MSCWLEWKIQHEMGWCSDSLFRNLYSFFLFLGGWGSGWGSRRQCYHFRAFQLFYASLQGNLYCAKICTNKVYTVVAVVFSFLMTPHDKVHHINPPQLGRPMETRVAEAEVILPSYYILWFQEQFVEHVEIPVAASYHPLNVSRIFEDSFCVVFVRWWIGIVLLALEKFLLTVKFLRHFWSETTDSQLSNGTKISMGVCNSRLTLVFA